MLSGQLMGEPPGTAAWASTNASKASSLGSGTFPTPHWTPNVTDRCQEALGSAASGLATPQMRTPLTCLPPMVLRRGERNAPATRSRGS